MSDDFFGLAAILVIGWFIGNALGIRRRRINKFREIQLTYLIEAYRRLEDCYNRGPSENGEYSRKLESALADFQLFGPDKLAKFAQSQASRLNQADTAFVLRLLKLLNNYLREELDMSHLQGGPVSLRNSSDTSTNT